MNKKDFKIVFMGTPEFAVPILEALIEEYQVIGVVTQPDKLVGRKQILTMSPVKECAIKHHIPVFQPIKIRVDYEEIKNLNPDLIITAAYGQLVGMELLDSPKYRSINVHGSLLPKYRGGSPIQTAIKNGETETGITIQYMEKGMDTGDILAMKAIPIENTDTSGTLFAKLSIVGRDLLLETIPNLIDGKIIPIKQNEEDATFAYNIKKEEETLNLNKTAIELYNQIRAFIPSPVANLTLDDETIKIYASRVSTKIHNQTPGTIIEVAKDYFTIACGNNTALDILKLQPAGKKIMNARDYINGGLKKHLK